MDLSHPPLLDAVEGGGKKKLTVLFITTIISLSMFKLRRTAGPSRTQGITGHYNHEIERVGIELDRSRQGGPKSMVLNPRTYERKIFLVYKIVESGLILFACVRKAGEWGFLVVNLLFTRPPGSLFLQVYPHALSNIWIRLRLLAGVFLWCNGYQTWMSLMSSCNWRFCFFPH